MSNYDVILSPVITEKSTRLSEVSSRAGFASEAAGRRWTNHVHRSISD